MRTDPKVLYILNKYIPSVSCSCKKCGSNTIYSPRKHYDYYCLNCKQLLFSDEVNVSYNKLTKKDKEATKELLIKHGTKI